MSTTKTNPNMLPIGNDPGNLVALDGEGKIPLASSSEVARTGNYNDLTDKPTIPSGYMADLDRATLTQIRSFTGNVGVTSERIKDAADIVDLGSGSSLTPDWENFVSGSFAVSTSSSTFDINNPQNVILGTVRVIWLLRTFSGSKYAAWGNNYTGPNGNPPEIDIEPTNLYKLIFEATPSGKILVSTSNYEP